MISRTQAASWYSHHPLLVIGLAPMLAVLVSVFFNVWYSVVYIEPLLTPHQNELLQTSLLLFNLVAFPLAGLIWGGSVASLRGPLQVLRDGQAIASPALERARMRAINLPWYFAIIVLVANVAVGVVLHAVVGGGAEPVFDAFDAHLLIAISMAALITITIAFFLIELLVMRLTFPLLFRDSKPYETVGGLALSLRMRAALMAVAGGVGPIVMLLLIGWADDAQRGSSNIFRIAVGALGVAFALVSAVLFSGLVMTPIRKLSLASRAVGAGDLDTQVEAQRVDEFGALIHEFNRMVRELRDKQQLRETFGLHVGEHAAEQILSRDPGLGGQIREITVLFCDIRGFTALSAARPAEEIVSLLNEFLSTMVDIVESRHGGMINKFLGDGFMALFGAGSAQAEHADTALAAARDMLQVKSGFRIGIGVHSGSAIVGNIGSTRRLEYTAIGETVNIASRLEQMTKTLSEPLILSGETKKRLRGNWAVRGLGRHEIRGQPAPIALYSL